MDNEEQTNLRISAMHLRLMDDEEQYQILLKHLLHYSVENNQMGEDVNSALDDGLRNHRKAICIENALSSRSIRIEKRQKPDGKPIYDTETEGYYQVILSFDDGSQEPIHFDKKQDQLLYILMTLCSLKNGLYANFFAKQEEGIREVVGSLIDIIWPNARENGDYANMMTNLRPQVYFTDIVQKMKAPIEKCVLPHGGADELIWFLPYTHKFGLRRIYQMRMFPTNILYPKEFQPIVDALPDTSKYVDISEKMPNKPLKGFENIDNIQMHEVMLREAEEGDLEAMNVVAGNYNWGTGVMLDQEKAFSWWKKAADLGLDEAQYYVGVFYATGDVVKQDYKIAADYLRKAAEQGYVDAIYQLGTFKRHGFGCRKNADKAIQLFEKAAEMGSIEAAKSAAFMYFHGEGVKTNYKKALKYYFELAEQDFDEAYWHIINCYLNGRGVEKDEAKAWEWMEKGINKEFNSIYYLTGLYLYNHKRYDEAYIAFTAAAERGVKAYKDLAVMNLEGLAGSKEEALQWLIKGVMIGDEDCEHIMWKRFRDEMLEFEKKYGNRGNKRFVLRTVMSQMGSDANRVRFLDLVDAYREVFREYYVQEINRQLSIHRPSTDDGGEDGSRRIVVRRTDSNKVGYEIVIILANGEEVVVNSINANSLMIYLLAIICSYKSGYSTEMAKSDACKPIISYLYKSVIPDSKDSEARFFIENYLDTARNNNYKTYSSRATQAITKAVDGKDEEDYYLFDNTLSKNRKVLRRMKLDVSDIELPGELIVLAQKMPDARNILYPSEKQALIE